MNPEVDDNPERVTICISIAAMYECLLLYLSGRWHM